MIIATLRNLRYRTTSVHLFISMTKSALNLPHARPMHYVDLYHRHHEHRFWRQGAAAHGNATLVAKGKTLPSTLSHRSLTIGSATTRSKKHVAKLEWIDNLSLDHCIMYPTASPPHISRYLDAMCWLISLDKMIYAQLVQVPVFQSLVYGTLRLHQRYHCIPKRIQQNPLKTSYTYCKL